MLSTKFKKVTLEEVLAHYSIKENWKEDLILFKNNNIEIRLTLCKIDVIDNDYSMRIKINGWFDFLYIPINNKEYTDKIFQNEIKRKIKNSNDVLTASNEYLEQMEEYYRVTNEYQEALKERFDLLWEDVDLGNLEDSIDYDEVFYNFKQKNEHYIEFPQESYTQESINDWAFVHAYFDMVDDFNEFVKKHVTQNQTIPNIEELIQEIQEMEL